MACTAAPASAGSRATDRLSVSATFASKVIPFTLVGLDGAAFLLVIRAFGFSVLGHFGEVVGYRVS